MATTISGAVTLPMLDDAFKFMAVKKALDAAVGGGGGRITDRLKKVEWRVENDMHIHAVKLQLLMWWDLGDGEYHVSTKEVLLHEGADMPDSFELLDEFLVFLPEDVLKYAAFL